MTVVELAELLVGLPDEMPVLIHIGWDLEITDVDVDEDGLILFADTSIAAVVSREWYEALND